jgi:hypothetical protein
MTHCIEADRAQPQGILDGASNFLKGEGPGLGAGIRLAEGTMSLNDRTRRKPRLIRRPRMEDF